MEQAGQVVELFLCESRTLVLKPGQLYRFTPDPDCDACQEALEEAGIARWEAEEE